jgi:Tol biopolymer transport system component
MSGKKVRHGVALAGVISGHVLLGFVWLVVYGGAVFLTSSETGWVDLVLLLGGVCWLGALAIIGIGWQSGSHWYWGVPVAWAVVFSIAAVVAVTDAVNSAGQPSGRPRPGTACPQKYPRAQSTAAGRRRGASVIAFDTRRDGEPEIYVVSADGSHQRRLTRNATEDAYPSWSPDGTKIAFTRQCWHSNGRSDWDDEIYVMNADGSGQRNLTHTRLWNEWYPAWSPDGTMIALQSDRRDELDIVVMNADGSGQKVLAQNGLEVGHPTWSPNGKQIAFVGTGLTIYVINLNGSGRRRLTDNTKVEGEDPAWSPVAYRIAFTCVTDLLTHHPVDAICTINPDGSALHRLTQRAENPAWAPDGTKMVFTRTVNGNPGIYVMKADGSGQKRIAKESADNLAWRPKPGRAAR